MSGRKKIYEALIDGSGQGLSDTALFTHVMAECPKATSKKIVRASLLALSDPDVRDANILHVIYALAIKHRLDPVALNDAPGDEDAQEKPKNAKGSGKKFKRKSGAKPDKASAPQD